MNTSTVVQSPKRRVVRDYSTGGLLDPLLRPRPHEQVQNWPQANRYNGPQHEAGTSAEQEGHEQTDFNLEAIEEKASYEASVTTQRTAMSNSSSSRIADFFSSEVFQVVLRNPTTAHQLQKFAQSRLCGENIDFLEKVRNSIAMFRYANLTKKRSIHINNR